jgi:adenylate cyclase
LSHVHEDVRDRLDTAFDEGGTRTLKNITRPVLVWSWQSGMTGTATVNSRANAASAT